MSHTTRYDLARYNAAELAVTMLPTNWKADGTVPAVIFCHGYSQDETTPYLSQLTGQVPLLNRLADKYPVVVGSQGSTAGLWGNDTMMTFISNTRTVMQGATVGAKAGKVILVGVSMGGLGILNWAKANPTLVAGVIIIIGVIDPEDIRANDRGGLAAALNTQYGGLYVDSTQKANKNPAYMATQGAYTNIPIQIWYDTNDLIIPQSITTTFATNNGANTNIYSVGALGHTEAAVQAVNLDTMMAFVDKVAVTA